MYVKFIILRLECNNLCYRKLELFYNCDISLCAIFVERININLYCVDIKLQQIIVYIIVNFIRNKNFIIDALDPYLLFQAKSHHKVIMCSG